MRLMECFFKHSIQSETVLNHLFRTIALHWHEPCGFKVQFPIVNRIISDDHLKAYVIG